MCSCRLCGKKTETKIPIENKYVRVCNDCQNAIAYKVNLEKNKQIIARIK